MIAIMSLDALYSRHYASVSDICLIYQRTMRVIANQSIDWTI